MRTFQASTAHPNSSARPRADLAVFKTVVDDIPMLNNDSLSQLKQLKQQLADLKETTEGTVKATQRSFGFVVLDDGREAFLSPEEMQKAFPGDRIKTTVTTDQKTNKTSASIDGLISSAVQTFVGRYTTRGKGHFVKPDLPRFTRWIFIPPNARNGANNGDYVRCTVSRHAFPQGKPQARVLAVIGNDKQAGIEASYMINKFQLQQDWPQDWPNQLAEADLDKLQDLTELPLVTIDNADTMDIDDALYAEESSDGWCLTVAIADPAALIPEGSDLDLEAQRRATSTYLPGNTINMLPEELAHERCSLQPGQENAALVCQLEVASDGAIGEYQMLTAKVKSSAKLHYQQVSDCLDNDAALAQSELLQTLAGCARALRQHRQQHHLLVNEKPEFQIQLNESRKIDRFTPHEKNSAQRLVEECMVAANRCAATFLGEQGLYIRHNGFRPEKLAEAKKLADEQLSLSDTTPSTAADFQQIMRCADQQEGELPTKSVLARMLERSYLSTEPGPHQGMALGAYTTITSPIRKYTDLLVHRLIKAKLADINSPAIEDNVLESLQQGMNNSRQARWQMEQWLKCQYLQPLKKGGFTGTICQVNSSGFTVRLDDTGIEGFVETKPMPEKFSFDPMRLRLKSKTQMFQLEQKLRINIAEVDADKRNILFTIAKADVCEGEQAAE